MENTCYPHFLKNGGGERRGLQTSQPGINTLEDFRANHAEINIINFKQCSDYPKSVHFPQD